MPADWGRGGLGRAGRRGQGREDLPDPLEAPKTGVARLCTDEGRDGTSALQGIACLADEGLDGDHYFSQNRGTFIIL